MNQKKEKSVFLREARVIFRYTLPVMAGYIFLGIAFGFLMRTNGFSALTPVVMSIAVYSGALEFAAVPILTSAFNPLGSFFIGLMLSARHIFYGIPMLKKYSGMKRAKPLLIFGLTDETFSILSSEEVPGGVRAKSFYLGVTLLNFSYWVLGTALGSVSGNLITFNAEGLDFVLTALFAVLFVDQLKSRQGRISGFTGLAASAAVLALFGSGLFVLVSMAVILIILLAGRKVISHE